MKQLAAAALLLAAPAALAQDFSANSEAKPWNLTGEEPARFEAEVVDMLCTVAGDCEDECSGRPRALGLLRSADDTLIFPMKNGEPVFAGRLRRARTLLRPDGRGGRADDQQRGSGRTQCLHGPADPRRGRRGVGAGTRWGQVWKEEHPDAGGGPWFRNDPRVNAAIEADGYLGLGQEADEAFIADWF